MGQIELVTDCFSIQKKYMNTKTSTKTALVVLKNPNGSTILHSFKYVTSRELREFGAKFLAQSAPMYFGTNWKHGEFDSRYVVSAYSTNTDSKIVVVKEEMNH